MGCPAVRSTAAPTTGRPHDTGTARETGLGGDAKQAHERHVDVEAERVHGRLTAPREAIDGAGRHARLDQPALLLGRVQQGLGGEPAQRRRDAVRAPVRHARDHEVIGADHRGDARHERPQSPQAGADVAHADLVAAVPDPDGHHARRPAPRVRRETRRAPTPRAASRPAQSPAGLSRPAHARGVPRLPVAAAHEQLVDGAVPRRHRGAARIEIVALAAAPRPLDGDQMRRALAAQQGRRHAVTLRIHEDVGLRAQHRQGRLQHGHVHGVGHVAHARAELPQRVPEHRRARRSVGLGRIGGDRETRRDEHAARREQRLRGGARPAPREERGDATPSGVESEEMVDRIPAARHARECTRREISPAGARPGRDWCAAHPPRDGIAARTGEVSFRAVPKRLVPGVVRIMRPHGAEPEPLQARAHEPPVVVVRLGDPVHGPAERHRFFTRGGGQLGENVDGTRIDDGSAR